VVMVFAFTGGRLSRREGLVLLAAYGLYTMMTAGLL
jgi:cation:H+ antiporter